MVTTFFFIIASHFLSYFGGIYFPCLYYNTIILWVTLNDPMMWYVIAKVYTNKQFAIIPKAK